MVDLQFTSEMMQGPGNSCHLRDHFFSCIGRNIHLAFCMHHRGCCPTLTKRQDHLHKLSPFQPLLGNEIRNCVQTLQSEERPKKQKGLVRPGEAKILTVI